MIRLTKVSAGRYKYEGFIITKTGTSWTIKRQNLEPLFDARTLAEVRDWLANQGPIPNNVVSLFNARPNPIKKPATESDFIQTINKNLENKKRLEKERKLNNKSTLRSYRIIK